MTDKKYGRGESEKEGFTYSTLMVAGMHFMDSYNYDVERVKRCVIHYAAPNGLIYPFCAYNSGPVFREKIEKEFSIPFEEQEEMKRLTARSKNSCGSCVGEPELVRISRAPARRERLPRSLTIMVLRLDEQLAFILEIDNLKTVLRRTIPRDVSRLETAPSIPGIA